MAKVTLWTRQDIRFLDVIQKEGLFQVKREYIQEKNQELTSYFIKLYDWFTQEASKRVPLPKGAAYPIWCSVSAEYMLRGAHGNVLVELSIDEDRVVYFDSPKWDLVLNHTYVAKDREDQMAFEADLKRRGLENSFALLDEHHSKFYPDLRKKVMDSWVNIFDFDRDKVNPFSLQANIWEIYPEDIVQILEGKEEQPIKIMGLVSQLKP